VRADRRENLHTMSGNFTLRPYQQAALAECGNALAAGRRPILVAPTGAGKTVLAVALIAAARAAGRRSLFLAPRRELVHQTVEKLTASGLPPGIVMAGEAPSLYAPVQVASLQTLHARLKKGGGHVPRADLVIVDEAHLSIAPSSLKVLEHYRDADVVGLTATPARGDGRALGIVFDQLVPVSSVSELTAEGFLCPAVYYAPSKPDLSEVKVQAGDYVQNQLERVMNAPQLIGDVVQHWHKLAAGRRTVVFASGIEHSQHLANAFNESGVRAEHVDAATPQSCRDAIFDRFRAGYTTILTNCFLASYGFDLPDLSCVVLARPTKSLVLYLQMVGRGLRPAPGKADALILDHSGAVDIHGFADEDRPWSLEGDETVQERQAKQRKAEPKAAQQEKVRTCGECRHVFRGSLVCPKCGWQVPRPARDVAVMDGELERRNGRQRQEQRDVYAELRMYAHSRGFKPGWAAHKFRELFQRFPPWAWNGDAMKVPSAETAGKVKYLAIRTAKAKARVAA
jgi:DNA repair protein RadD